MTGGQGDRSRARRAAALALHPDVGGDAEQFMAALAAIDQRFQSVDVTIRRSHWSRLRITRKLFRRTRGRLPMGRRYISL